MFIYQLESRSSLQNVFIINSDQEMLNFLNMCNLCRYAWFLQAQSKISAIATYQSLLTSKLLDHSYFTVQPKLKHASRELRSIFVKAFCLLLIVNTMYASACLRDGY